MKKKQIIGVVIISVGVGVLSYLYNNYYKAYKEIKEEKEKETTTTK